MCYMVLVSDKEFMALNSYFAHLPLLYLYDISTSVFSVIHELYGIMYVILLST